MTASHSRRLFMPLFCLLALTCCSCMQTPQEKLIGRWYNRDNSVRFNADGTLVWNARSGRAYGLYWYTGASRVTSTNQIQPNMTMQLRTESGDIVAKYEVQFLGDEKLRIQRVNADRRTPSRLMVLTKAGPDDEKTTELVSL
ncbi:MAG: hypothetical protein ACYTGL_13670 [Planctomycetota bacterium]|jgi:hypothetical protein